jgi:hypothetical protein
MDQDCEPTDPENTNKKMARAVREPGRPEDSVFYCLGYVTVKSGKYTTSLLGPFPICLPPND